MFRVFVPLRAVEAARAALSSIYYKHGHEERSAVPLNDVEENMCDIFCALLGLQSVSKTKEAQSNP